MGEMFDTLKEVGILLLFVGGLLSLRWLRSLGALGSNMDGPGKEKPFQTLFGDNDNKPPKK